MNTGGEVAGIVAGLYAELGKKGLDIGTKILSALMLSLLKVADRKLNTGEISMKRMLESGDEIKQVKINIKDSTNFIKKAKKYGITFSLLDKIPDDDKYTVVYKEKEQEIVNNILKDILKDKEKGIDISEDKSLVDEFLVGGSKDFYIVDKENPQNYISSNIEQLDIQKGMLVNKNNPDEYIEFDENIKEKSLSIKIYKPDKDTEVYDTIKLDYNDVKSKVITVASDWKGAVLLYDEEERQKLKDKIIKDKEKVADEKNSDKKTMQQVEGEVKSIRANQPKSEKSEKTKTKSENQKTR